MQRRAKWLALFVGMLAAACGRNGGARAPAVSTEQPVANAAPSTTLQHRSLTSGGHARTFLLYAPQDASPLPLVIALHGRLGDGAGEEKLSHFSRVAEREHFVLALPDGYSRSWNDSRDVTPASKEKYDDVAYLSDLIDALVKENLVDPTRVYVTGMSNGGFMAETFACNAGDRVAAIAMVGALLPDTLTSCHPAHPMPTMIIIGDHDPLVPYAGGEMGKGGERGNVKSADDTAKFWADANGCTTRKDDSLPDTDPDDDTHTLLTQFLSCRDASEVSLLRVIGGGHTWPGGYQYLGKWLIGRTSHDFDASERIWAFFKGKTNHGT
jgi:polyhydroxybutyrate depolymerase